MAAGLGLCALALIVLGDAQLSGRMFEEGPAWWPLATGAAALASGFVPGGARSARFTFVAGLAPLLFALATARIAPEPAALFGSAVAVVGWCWLAAGMRAPALVFPAELGALIAIVAGLVTGVSSGFACGAPRGFAPAVLAFVFLGAAALVGRRLAFPDGGARSDQPEANLLGATGLFSLLIGLSLFVLEIFGAGELTFLEVDTGSSAQVALSIAWALFAIGLLALGRRTSGKPLRVASLVVLFVALAKLFLLDLSDLQGLYRVVSIAGLAACLLAVSLFYQRFVFGRSPGETTGVDPAAG